MLFIFPGFGTVIVDKALLVKEIDALSRSSWIEISSSEYGCWNVNTESGYVAYWFTC